MVILNVIIKLILLNHLKTMFLFFGIKFAII